MNEDSAIAHIENERRRQLSEEGWTPEHDDQHSDGSMLRAAVIYWQHAARPDIPLQFDLDGRPVGWSWERKWWKPKDRFRDLVRAGALCLAERDRLRRAHARRQSAGPHNNADWWPPHVKHKFVQIVNSLQDAA